MPSSTDARMRTDEDALNLSTPKTFVEELDDRGTIRQYQPRRTIFAQGDAADAVYYLQRGKIKLSLVSPRGREAIIGIVGADAFFGEGCLAGQAARVSSAMTITACTVARIPKSAIQDMLHEQPRFAEVFTAHLLSRNVRIEEDLTDQLFNSSEKRLARILLLLANYGKDALPEPAIAKLSQQTLAGMVGTTRSRVSFFMNKFRALGYIQYDGGANVHVHASLLNVILHE
jgi:CRP/FNR family transcriptional regulator, cyclic AMP receptor protein